MQEAKTPCCRSLISWVATGLFFFLPLAGFSQSTVKLQPEIPVADDLKKYPGLLAELTHLVEALKNTVQFPSVRTESSFLPRLPSGPPACISFIYPFRISPSL